MDCVSTKSAGFTVMVTFELRRLLKTLDVNQKIPFHERNLYNSMGAFRFRSLLFHSWKPFPKLLYEPVQTFSSSSARPVSGYPGSPHVRRFPRVTFAREGPAADLTRGEEFVVEAFTLSHHVTETLDAPNQETTLFQGVEQALTHGDRLRTKRLSSRQRDCYKQVHDRIWETAQHPVHLGGPAFIALQHRRTPVGSRGLHCMLTPHLLS